MKSGRLLDRRSATRSCARIVSASKKSIRERVSENGRDFVIDFDIEDGRFGNPQSYKAYVREPDYALSYLACVELSPDGSVSVDRWYRTGKDDFEPEDYSRTISHAEGRLREMMAEDDAVRSEFAMEPFYAVIRTEPGGERHFEYTREVVRYPSEGQAVARAQKEWASVPESERKRGHTVKVLRYASPFWKDNVLTLEDDVDYRTRKGIIDENARNEVMLTKEHSKLTKRLETHWQKVDPLGYQMAQEGNVGSPHVLLMDKLQYGGVPEIIERLKADAGMFPKGSADEKRRLELIEQLSALPLDSDGMIVGMTYGEYRRINARKAAEARRRKAEEKRKTEPPKAERKKPSRPRKASSKPRKDDAPSEGYVAPDWWYLSREIYQIYVDYDPFDGGGDLMDYLGRMLTEPENKRSMIWELRSNAEKFAEFGRPDLSKKLLALVPRVEALTYEDFKTTASKRRKPKAKGAKR